MSSSLPLPTLRQRRTDSPTSWKSQHHSERHQGPEHRADLSADADLDIDLTDIETMRPMDWDTILGDYDAELDSFVDKWRETQDEVAQYSQTMQSAIMSAMGNGLQAITDMMFGLEGAEHEGVLAGVHRTVREHDEEPRCAHHGGRYRCQALKNLIKENPTGRQSRRVLPLIGPSGFQWYRPGVQKDGVNRKREGGSVATPEHQAQRPRTIKTELTVYVEGRYK